jgi:hypothetical protein
MAISTHTKERDPIAVHPDTFANFSCEGYDCREDLGVLVSGIELMPSADNVSLPERVRANARLTTRAIALLGLVLSGTVSAAEPPVTVNYQSATAGYRHFEAEAPAVDWREANDAIRDGAEGGAQGMRGMRTPMEAPPANEAAPPPATPAEFPARPQ